MKENNLTSSEIDALREVGNIGAGNATTALSVLLDSRLSMEVPVVKTMEFDEVANMVGGAETIITAVLTRCTGDVNGMVFFILEMEEAKNLASLMLHKTYSDDVATLEYMDRSVLKEVGNILMSSYIGSIGTLTGLELRANPPAICVDMAGAVLSQPLTILGQVGDLALIIDSKILDDNHSINGFIMFVADDESFDNIYSALGIR